MSYSTKDLCRSVTNPPCETLRNGGKHECAKPTYHTSGSHDPGIYPVYALGFSLFGLSVGVRIYSGLCHRFFRRIPRKKIYQITTFGKFMDPLADKVLVCSAMICFVADGDCPMPVWVVIVIIAREFIISGFRLVAAEKGVVIAASYWAKIKTAVQMIMSIVLIFNFQHPIFFFIDRILIYAALILTVLSLVDYIYKNRDVMSDVS